MRWLVAILVGLIGPILLIRWMGYATNFGGLVFDNDGLRRLEQRRWKRPRLVIGSAVVSANIDIPLMAKVTPGLAVFGAYVGPSRLLDDYPRQFRVFGRKIIRNPEP